MTTIVRELQRSLRTTEEALAKDGLLFSYRQTMNDIRDNLINAIDILNDVDGLVSQLEDRLAARA